MITCVDYSNVPYLSRGSAQISISAPASAAPRSGPSRHVSSVVELHFKFRGGARSWSKRNSRRSWYPALPAAAGSRARNTHPRKWQNVGRKAKGQSRVSAAKRLVLVPPLSQFEVKVKAPRAKLVLLRRLVWAGRRTKQRFADSLILGA